MLLQPESENLMTFSLSSYQRQNVITIEITEKYTNMDELLKPHVNQIFGDFVTSGGRIRAEKALAASGLSSVHVQR